MTMPFSLPGDRIAVEAALRGPGGLAAVEAGSLAHLHRAIGQFDLVALIGLAERLPAPEVVRLYEIWLTAREAEAQPAGIWFNLGVARMQCGLPAEAATAYRNALILKPDLAEAAINLGNALETIGQKDAGFEAWRAALPVAPLRLVLHNQLGRVLEERGALGAAAEELRASLLIDPDQPDVQQHLIHLRQRITAWPVVDLRVPGLQAAEAARNCGPLAALALTDDLQVQTDAAAVWIARKAPAVSHRLSPARGYAHDRIRIGYLSSDFCRHAMSFLIAEMLELHDRDRFEVYGYCTSAEDGSDIRQRVIAAFDRFVPIRTLSDSEAAERIRQDEIDILIDLNGLTKGARVGVLRWKPAPVQITYLGYIGPIPLPELDYILCDAVTIPAELEAGYQPRPLRIAGCYQANDSHPPAPVSITRAEEGLPEPAFVFCCASHHYKIIEPMFEAWCSILSAVPGSVLWLINDNVESRAALTGRWLARGLEGERLLFAERTSPDRYRARLALADLFLDTFPYNAGTIASDALRMGLPIVTLQGRAFAARMASSLLTAVGLEDCITRDYPAYVAKAVEIASDRQVLARIRHQLAGDRWARTLGDSRSFTRRIEQSYQSVVLRGAGDPSPVIQAR